VTKFLKVRRLRRAGFEQERYAPTNHSRSAGGEGNERVEDGLK
jgi:hypothetical protein